ncbi:membrane-associated phospholipid phosphatase [Sphingomonas sp. BE138]|uniref:phosphatase PAP2 family protein n=1 Tax=Sphingomonas sp. BE138 TaxID=2817845 RepID=UPI00286757A6|nr:phosphatase PAP2 family protein [Sphingomonas sp. BE138]MDR6788226.1 membrane-associated phospholipid phosphatase [Sphingomonas sp. BE138]
MGKKKKKALREAAAREHDATEPLRALAATGAMRALAPIAKATDEPPLLALGLGTLAIGAVLRRPALARSGARMVASHLLATGLKTVLKAGVDRARPNATGKAPKLGKGHGTGDTALNAFPSGHTAGAVAVAQSIGHEAPGIATAAKLAAGTAGAAQVARGAHYTSDVVAGAVIGWVAERVASLAIDAGERFAETRRDAKAEEEVEAHPS